MRRPGTFYISADDVPANTNDTPGSSDGTSVLANNAGTSADFGRADTLPAQVSRIQVFWWELLLHDHAGMMIIAIIIIGLIKVIIIINNNSNNSYNNNNSNNNYNNNNNNHDNNYYHYD